MSSVLWLALVLVLFKLAVQLLLEALNRSEVRKHGEKLPDAFAGIIEPQAYTKAVSYTLAKSRFSQLELLFDSALLALVLFSGVLPASFSWFKATAGHSAWAMAAWLFAVSVLLSLPRLPLDWIDQFRLEARFGFNTTTQKTWWLDRFKALILALLLGLPLLWLIIKLVDWTGQLWWIWAWAAIVLFQIVMMVLAPVLILPLFNKLTPLPDGPLRERLLALGAKTGFHARNILVMDGSKRSRHSNAFFTGFGRWRKIVLFDTLIQQLDEPELEAVLAHEIGHYKKGHIPKMLLASTLGMFVMFFAIAQLARAPWFYSAFGFTGDSIVPALLLFSLLSGTITFWLAPIGNLVSRRFEYQADRYAREIMGHAAPMVGALRKLNEKNSSNLTPHRLYSGFYYSHPTLLERERSLRA